jgi:hypothetical protein
MRAVSQEGKTDEIKASLKNNLMVCRSAFCCPIGDCLSSCDVFTAFSPQVDGVPAICF